MPDPNTDRARATAAVLQVRAEAFARDLEQRLQADDGLFGRIHPELRNQVIRAALNALEVGAASPSSSLLGEAFANRIAIRAGELLDERDPRVPEIGRAELGRLVVDAATEELGEVPLSTLIRSKIASTAGVIDRAGSTEGLGQAAHALVELATAANTLKLGENAERDHRAALERVTELERRAAELESELADVKAAGMPEGAYFVDVRLNLAGAPPPEAIVEVGATGRRVAAVTSTRETSETALREAIHSAANAIADDAWKRLAP